MNFFCFKISVFQRNFFKDRKNKQTLFQDILFNQTYKIFLVYLYNIIQESVKILKTISTFN